MATPSVVEGPLGVNVLFLLFSCFLTAMLLWEHSHHLYSLSLQKNAARLFVIGPVYTLLSLLAAWGGDSKPLWGVVASWVDGYSLFVFFALIILGCGGEDSVIKKLDAIVASEGANALNIKLCCCIPIKLKNGAEAYTFFKRSVLQLLITRPFLVGLGALAAMSDSGEVAMKVLRAMAIVCLVYAVLIIGNTYHKLHASLWQTFRPVATFFVIKTYILIIVIQEFIVNAMLTKRGVDPEAHTKEADAAWQGVALLVAVESLFYLLLLRCYLNHKVFRDVNPHVAPVSSSMLSFWWEVLKVWSVMEKHPTQGAVVGEKLDADADDIELTTAA